jgi:hypothetical protein
MLICAEFRRNTFDSALLAPQPGNPASGLQAPVRNFVDLTGDDPMTIDLLGQSRVDVDLLRQLFIYFRKTIIDTPRR